MNIAALHHQLDYENLAIFNQYSQHALHAHPTPISHGTNPCITPDKLNTTQLFTTLETVIL
jgi:hypothetical protein